MKRLAFALLLATAAPVAAAEIPASTVKAGAAEQVAA